MHAKNPSNGVWETADRLATEDLSTPVMVPLGGLGAFLASWRLG
jgi:hypothetical protein